MARFGMRAVQSARTIVRDFRSGRTRALFAGLAAHSFLSLDQPLSAATGLLMAILAHAVGWPIPRAGSQSLTAALCSVLAAYGTKVRTSSPVETLSALPDYDLIFCDLTPKQLLKVAGDRLSDSYKDRLQTYRYGPGVFKVDYALHTPIPWKASECSWAWCLIQSYTGQDCRVTEHAVRASDVNVRQRHTAANQ